MTQIDEDLMSEKATLSRENVLDDFKTAKNQLIVKGGSGTVHIGNKQIRLTNEQFDQKSSQ